MNTKLRGRNDSFDIRASPSKNSHTTQNIRFKTDFSLRIASQDPDALFSRLSRQFKVINSCLSILEARRKEGSLHLPWLVKVVRNSESTMEQPKKSKMSIRKQYSNNLYAKLLKRTKEHSPVSEHHKAVHKTLALKKILLADKSNLSPSCMKAKYNSRNRTLNSKDVQQSAKSAKTVERSCKGKSVKRSIIFSSIAPMHDELRSCSSSDSEASYTPILNPKFVRGLSKDYNIRVKQLLNSTDISSL
eukprot:TRINITY_DN14753_c0_g2_i11.p1 TRINITY_DN14753_c0_g2~~TRINITY_DN14753_c0_g2_i11.p1  ORF type:complete len:246 (+),score=51.22 TRINITY_DN14753_c0_g2_i11:125-862(+)